MDGKRDSFFLSNKHNKKQEKPKQEYKSKRQDEFDKNREEEGKKTIENKKPFDKKAYRLKKYSKKYKLEQWEEQRKKKLLRDYYKDSKDEPSSGSFKSKPFDEDTVDSSQYEIGRFVKHPDIIEKENKKNDDSSQNDRKDPYQKAKERYNKVKQEKIDKKQLIEKAKDERNQKLQEYKKKKQERFKKLSKKTKKGQPVMTGRLELLLEKIQKRSN